MPASVVAFQNLRLGIDTRSTSTNKIPTQCYSSNAQYVRAYRDGRRRMFKSGCGLKKETLALVQQYKCAGSPYSVRHCLLEEATASENCFTHLDSENDGRAKSAPMQIAARIRLFSFMEGLLAVKVAQFDSAKDGI